MYKHVARLGRASHCRLHDAGYPNGRCSAVEREARAPRGAAYTVCSARTHQWAGPGGPQRYPSGRTDPPACDDRDTVRCISERGDAIRPARTCGRSTTGRTRPKRRVSNTTRGCDGLGIRGSSARHGLAEDRIQQRTNLHRLSATTRLLGRIHPRGTCRSCSGDRRRATARLRRHQSFCSHAGRQGRAPGDVRRSQGRRRALSFRAGASASVWAGTARRSAQGYSIRISRPLGSAVGHSTGTHQGESAAAQECSPAHRVHAATVAARVHRWPAAVCSGRRDESHARREHARAAAQGSDGQALPARARRLHGSRHDGRAVERG